MLSDIIEGSTPPPTKRSASNGSNKRICNITYGVYKRAHNDVVVNAIQFAVNSLDIPQEIRTRRVRAPSFQARNENNLRIWH